MKAAYERKLRVTALFSRYKERVQYTLQEYKKGDEGFTLTIIENPGLFELGDKVTLRIEKDLGPKERVM